MDMRANLHHVAMAVEDMDCVKAFYLDVLGFEVDWENENYTSEMFANVVGLQDSGAHVVMLKGYGTRLELFHYHSPLGEKIQGRRQCDYGLTHFAFTVQNIHSLYERLKSAGVIFNCPPQNLRPGAWITYMKDPEGNTMELVEYQ